MENKMKLIESLFESTLEYGKSSIELTKLKVLQKTSEVVSTSIPPALVFVVIKFFMLFVSLGMAFWLGEILENFFYGFFIVAAFYGITALIMYFFMFKWIKKRVKDYLIKQLFK